MSAIIYEFYTNLQVTCRWVQVQNKKENFTHFTCAQVHLLVGRCKLHQSTSDLHSPTSDLHSPTSKLIHTCRWVQSYMSYTNLQVTCRLVQVQNKKENFTHFTCAQVHLLVGRVKLHQSTSDLHSPTSEYSKNSQYLLSIQRL